MSKNWKNSWLGKSSKTRQQSCRSESFAMKTGIPTNGSMVKIHISLKTGFECSVISKTSFLLRFQACQQIRHQDLIHQLQRHLQDRRVITQHLLQARLHHQPWYLQLCQATVWLDKHETCVTYSYPVTVSSKHVERQERWDLFSSVTKTNKNEDHDQERRDPWLENERIELTPPLGRSWHPLGEADTPPMRSWKQKKTQKN